MKASSPEMPAFRPRNLLGVLSFLKRYSGRVALAIGLLLFNIGLEMTLPRISGTAINQMRTAIATHTVYHPWNLAGLFVGLALLRSVVGFILGRIRNRVV